MQKAIKLGMAMAARIPITAITIINPVCVKPVLAIFLIWAASKFYSDYKKSTFYEFIKFEWYQQCPN